MRRPTLEDVYLDLVDEADAEATHVRLFWHELRTQQLLFWRNRESAVFIFVFPPMLFLLLGAVYDGKIDGVPAVDRLLVGMMGYGCANTALAGLAITLVVRREGGLLKRLRATPLPAATYLTAVLVSTLIVFLLQMAVTVALGVTLYGARGAESWVALVARAPARRRGVRGARDRARGADPLGRGRLGRGQPRSSCRWRSSRARSARRGTTRTCSRPSRTCFRSRI